MSAKESGGKLAVNFGQGLRAEHLAQYLLSEFGPCTRVMHEDDYGLDLICSLMTEAGSVGHVRSLYGIQVKSGDEPFSFNGEHVWEWLKRLNVPLFFARVDRQKAALKLYCSWTLGLLLVWDENQLVNNTVRFDCNDSLSEPLKSPEPAATETIVHLGKPILEINAMSLHKTEVREKIFRILGEWVSFEVENYASRFAGISMIFGYRTWDTNKSLKESQRIWYRPYVFGGACLRKAEDAFIKAAVIMGLSWKGSNAHGYEELMGYLERSGLRLSNEQKGLLGVGTEA